MVRQPTPRSTPKKCGSASARPCGWVPMQNLYAEHECNNAGSVVARINIDSHGAAGKYATVGQRRKRGGKHVSDKHKRRMGRKMEVKVGTLNPDTMTGKGRELADMMVKRKVDILCVQETRWKGSKARNIGDGCNIFYHGEDGRRNGVGVILKEDYIGRILEVKRVSDRMMYMKLDIEGVMMTVLSAYAPQVGGLREEKDKFWTDLDEVVESIPKEERLVIGADFNGHIGEGNRVDDNVMGRYGDKARNAEGQMAGLEFDAGTAAIFRRALPTGRNAS